MDVILEIKKKKTRLVLRKQREIIDYLEWEEKNFLSRNLLQKLDKLLKRNQLTLDTIRGYSIISDMPKSWTSVRVAKITLEGLKIGQAV